MIYVGLSSIWLLEWKQQLYVFVAKQIGTSSHSRAFEKLRFFNFLEAEKYDSITHLDASLKL